MDILIIIRDLSEGVHSFSRTEALTVKNLQVVYVNVLVLIRFYSLIVSILIKGRVT